MNDQKTNYALTESRLNDGLAVLFGSRWIVTREVPRERNGPEMIAICRNEDLAISVIRARSDHNKYGIEYDCIEVDNYE